MLRHVASDALFLGSASGDAEVIGALRPGDEFWMLDDTRGWAWGYGGPDRRVGYVRAEALGI